MVEISDLIQAASLATVALLSVTVPFWSVVLTSSTNLSSVGELISVRLALFVLKRERIFVVFASKLPILLSHGDSIALNHKLFKITVYHANIDMI